MQLDTCIFNVIRYSAGLSIHLPFTIDMKSRIIDLRARTHAQNYLFESRSIDVYPTQLD